MKVADLLDARRQNWRELEILCSQMEHRTKRRLGGAAIMRFATLYRAACADLALADAYQLPQHTVRYLHHLVGRAHNQLYRSRKFNVSAWMEQLFVEVPRKLFHDIFVRVAFLVFYGCFLACMVLSIVDESVSERVAGPGMLEGLDNMYSQEIGKDANIANSGMMSGFYIRHNTSIGLRVFAMGLVFGVLGLFETIYNASVLGAAFGYMATTSHWNNFFTFVTAHGPFELNAIVLSAAAGMRLGFGLIETRGWTRKASLERAAKEAIYVMSVAVLLFVGAAFIEGFISPSPLWYEFKMMVAFAAQVLLMLYFVFLGSLQGNRANPAASTVEQTNFLITCIVCGAVEISLLLVCIISLVNADAKYLRAFTVMAIMMAPFATLMVVSVLQSIAGVMHRWAGGNVEQPATAIMGAGRGTG